MKKQGACCLVHDSKVKVDGILQEASKSIPPSKLPSPPLSLVTYKGEELPDDLTLLEHCVLRKITQPSRLKLEERLFVIGEEDLTGEFAVYLLELAFESGRNRDSFHWLFWSLPLPGQFSLYYTSLSVYDSYCYNHDNHGYVGLSYFYQQHLEMPENPKRRKKKPKIINVLCTLVNSS